MSGRMDSILAEIRFWMQAVKVVASLTCPPEKAAGARGGPS